MTYPDIRTAVGRERLNTLLADAEAARQARQARLYRRQAATPALRGSPLRRQAGTGTRVMLRDGSAVVIRQVHRNDAPLLADGFARLSAESRRMRFLRPNRLARRICRPGSARSSTSTGCPAALRALSAAMSSPGWPVPGSPTSPPQRPLTRRCSTA
jgi:hypothetical protein